VSQERRRRTRAPFQMEVVVTVDGQDYEGYSTNISLQGILLNLAENLTQRKICQVAIPLAPEVKPVMLGKIIRSGGGETAIEFLDMDEETFGHLKTIVEYHAAQPEKISQELLTPAFSEFLFK